MPTVQFLSPLPELGWHSLTLQQQTTVESASMLQTAAQAAITVVNKEEQTANIGAFLP